MADNFSGFSYSAAERFKESSCIDVYKVYDSSADRDFIENQRVLFTDAAQNVIDQANSVKLRDVSVINVQTDLQKVPFRKGYYSANINLFFEVNLEAVVLPCGTPTAVSGLTIYNKKTILYGAEGGVKTFTSDSEGLGCFENTQIKNLPRCTVHVADPVALSAEICDLNACCECCNCRIPDGICKRFGGNFLSKCDAEHAVGVSIGLFTIIQIERNVQMMVPNYELSIPTRQCAIINANPCDLFSRIDFPTDEFFPPDGNDSETTTSCERESTF